LQKTRPKATETTNLKTSPFSKTVCAVEVLMVVKMLMLVLWVVMLGELVDTTISEGTYCLHLQY
jgi:hypothetical protein